MNERGRITPQATPERTRPAELDGLPARAGVACDLRKIELELWRELAQAPLQREHGWRHMVLASQGPDGVDARTVVLRECDDVARSLVFYTDARSPKLAQLHAQPRAVLVAWSAELGWQLRLTCRVEVATHGLGVASRWARIRCTPAAQDYLFPIASGTTLPHGHSGMPARPAPAELEHHHFAVMTAHVEVLDWLELGAPLHRRARYTAHGADWLAP
jgi:pyridoxine/pyridoxamine 5'-phosphate oxidase